MLSLLAAAVLTSTEPSAALLAPHFVLALTQEPAPTVAPRPDLYAGRSKRWLMSEVRYLEASRPAIAPQALVAGGGAALLIVSIIGAVLPNPPCCGATGKMPGELLAVFGIAGSVAMVVGGLLLFMATGKTAKVEAEIDAAQLALERASEDPIAPPPGAPPAAMPPQVRLPPPAIGFTVAQF